MRRGDFLRRLILRMAVTDLTMQNGLLVKATIT